VIEFDIPGCELSVKYFGGNCPVQAEGKINDHKFYFRARGDCIEIFISYTDKDPIESYFEELAKHVDGEIIDEEEVNKDVFVYQEDYGKCPEAGYIDEVTAKEFMERAFNLFKQETDKTHEL